MGAGKVLREPFWVVGDAESMMGIETEIPEALPQIKLRN
jgi:hypothetical protein